MLTDYRIVYVVSPRKDHPLDVDQLVESLNQNVAGVQLLGDSFERRRRHVRSYIQRRSMTDQPCRHPEILLRDVDGLELRNGPGMTFQVTVDGAEIAFGHVWATGFKVHVRDQVPDELAIWMTELAAGLQSPLEQLGPSRFDSDF